MISGLRIFHLRGSVRGAALAFALTLACVPSFCQNASTPGFPYYTAQGIVHAATQTAQALAPNTIATIYGTNLAFSTQSAGAVAGALPTEIDGVSVNVSGGYANLFFISPTQINFLIPYQFSATATVSVIVVRQSAAGPTVQIQLNPTAPGLFVYNGFAMATHLNGTLISPALPATSGEIIVLYVVGLGHTTPDTTSGRIVSVAAPITALSQLQVELNGKICPPANVLYAGLAPGFAGLYQINLIVPPLTPSNPEIRVAVGNQISPASVLLALQ
jgi:uncharacterized protein (TIGR03437 family)